MSQRKRILNDLLEGREITPLDALKNYNCFRLASAICDLRKKGHNIITRNVSKSGGRGKYAAYSLKK